MTMTRNTEAQPMNLKQRKEAEFRAERDAQIAKERAYIDSLEALEQLDWSDLPDVGKD